MAYLVTGGTGFIGSYLVRDLLKEKKEVVCLQRSGVTDITRSVVGEDDLSKVKIVQGDVSHAVQLFRLIRDYNIDLVVHLGNLSTDISEVQPAYAVQVNCVGMNNLLEAGRLLGLKRIVWASSDRAFGRVNQFYDKPIMDDDGIYVPDTMYGATKVLNEYMSKLYFEKFGVDCLGLRLAATFGLGRQWGSVERLNKLLRSAALNIPTKTAIKDASIIRCFSYVENISDLIIKACNAPVTRTRTFNTPEYKYSFRRLVEAIRKVNPGAQVTIEEGVETADSVWSGAGPMVDTTRVYTELGWKPKYSLEEMIRKIMNYYRQREGLSPL